MPIRSKEALIATVGHDQISNCKVCPFCSECLANNLEMQWSSQQPSKASFLSALTKSPFSSSLNQWPSDSLYDTNWQPTVESRGWCNNIMAGNISELKWDTNKEVLKSYNYISVLVTIARRNLSLKKVTSSFEWLTNIGQRINLFTLQILWISSKKVLW